MPLPIVPAPITPTVLMSMILKGHSFSCAATRDNSNLQADFSRRAAALKAASRSNVPRTAQLKLRPFKACLRPDHDPAIHRNYGTVNKARLVGCEPGIRVGDVFRRAGSAQGRARDHRLKYFFR